jgi:predicted amidohydrolase
MKGNKTKVAIGQMEIVSGEVSRNLAKISEMSQRASRQGAKLIAFPELATCGSDSIENGMKLFEIINRIPGKTSNCLVEIARENNIYLVVGMGQKSAVPGRLFNSQVVISPIGEIKEIYQKIHLNGMEQLFWKNSVDKKTKLVPFPFQVAGMMLGDDIDSRNMVQKLIAKGAQLLLLSTAITEDKVNQWKENLMKIAKDKQLTIIATNSCGKDGNKKMAGYSSILDAKGNIMAEATTREEIIFAEIDCYYKL